ncbi:MAG: helix-turn-helix domain-containing protein [Acidobacteria bacterium]|nr:helix-turn-helix domain-containing protein [Acidobacteriota bacterium]
MRVEARHPKNWLSQYVDHVWRCTGFAEEDPDIRGWLLPEPGFNLVFNLGAIHRVWTGPTPEEHRTSWVAGERTRPVAIAIDGPTAYVGVRFHAGAAAAFLGAGAAELTDRTFDLDLLWGEFAEVTRQRLYEAPDMDAVSRVMFDSLEQRFDNHCAPPATLGAMLAALRRAAPGASIRDEAADLGVSHSTLLRQFDHWVGTRPKMMHRLLRFERVLLAESCASRPRWSDIALDTGYYDQAHLVHDFRAFARMSPAAYRNALCPLPASVLVDTENVARTAQRFKRGAVLAPS